MQWVLAPCWTDAATLAVHLVCDRAATLDQKGLVPAEAAPQLWLACGQLYENEADYGAAIAAYEQVLQSSAPRFEEIAPCEDCRTYSLEGPEVCPNKGPTATFTLQPGDYEVLVRSVSDPRVTPFTGVWALNTGEAYKSCFYLVQSPA